MMFGWFSLRQLRYIKRYRQILQVLVKYGFAQILLQLGLYGVWVRLFHRGGRRNRTLPHQPEARLRMALEELGPAFIKVGQLLSTRTDLLPLSYTRELSRLQDDVPPFPFQAARQILEAELKGSLEEKFLHFNPQPLAAASIGQVHRATLRGGEEVVVKIKRPGVNKQVRDDLEILTNLAALVERKTGLGSLYQFSRIAEEIRQIVLRELDYLGEARNAQRFKHNLAGDPRVYIPEVYWDYTTGNVLTLEYRRGVTLNRYLESSPSKPPPQEVARVLTETFLKQVFGDGFFHADPHPGNIAVLPDGTLFFMDFGSAGFISEDLQARLTALFWAFSSADSAAIVDELLGLAFAPAVVNRPELIRDIALIHEQYYDLPLQSLNLSEALQGFVRVAARHHLRFPYEFLLLGRAMITLEGTVTRLDPEFSIAEAARRYGPLLQGKQIKFAARRFKGTLRGYRRLVEEIPERTVEILRETAAGELKFNVGITRMEAALKTLENMVNRLSFSIVLAALILAISRYLEPERLPWLPNIPLGEIALIGVGLAGLWWLFAIIRSGRL